jgi:hypothetical protein
MWVHSSTSVDDVILRMADDGELVITFSDRAASGRMSIYLSTECADDLIEKIKTTRQLAQLELDDLPF